MIHFAVFGVDVEQVIWMSCDFTFGRPTVCGPRLTFWGKLGDAFKAHRLKREQKEKQKWNRNFINQII